MTPRRVRVVRLVLASGVLIGAQLAVGGIPRMNAAVTQLAPASSLSASANAVLVGGSDAVVKLMPVRRDARHRSVWRPWVLVAVVPAIKALRLLARSRGAHGRWLRIDVLGRSMQTRAPPRLQPA